MNTTVNIGLATAAVALITLCVNTIQTNLIAGLVEGVLGIAIWGVYHFLP